MKSNWFLLLLALYATCDARKSYLGDKVYHINPRTQNDIKILDYIWKTQSVETGIDFWSNVHPGAKNITVHVTREQKAKFEKMLQSAKIDFQASHQVLEDVAKRGKVGYAVGNFLNSFLNYNQITAQMLSFAHSCGSVCKVESIGRTWEKRDINMLRIEQNPSSPYVWVDCGIHAREWISPATCMYFINKLVSSYGSDSRVTKLRNSYNFLIVPVLNPDGYQYTHSNDRFWRKNRNPNSQWCHGVDLNRNWGFKWGGRGTSSSSCSDIYRGTSGFSEPETKAVSQFLTPLASKTRAFFTLHSYGQYWLVPFGYEQNTYPANYQSMLSAARKAEKAVRAVNGRSYSVGHSANLLYPAAGGSDDWANSIGIPYTYTLELPDTDRYGFELPAVYIPSVGAEIYEAIAKTLEIVQ